MSIYCALGTQCSSDRDTEYNGVSRNTLSTARARAPELRHDTNRHTERNHNYNHARTQFSRLASRHSLKRVHLLNRKTHTHPPTHPEIKPSAPTGQLLAVATVSCMQCGSTRRTTTPVLHLTPSAVPAHESQRPRACARRAPTRCMVHNIALLVWLVLLAVVVEVLVLVVRAFGRCSKVDSVRRPFCIVFFGSEQQRVGAR